MINSKEIKIFINRIKCYMASFNAEMRRVPANLRNRTKRIIVGRGASPRVYFYDRTIDLDEGFVPDINCVYIFRCDMGQPPYPAFTNKDGDQSHCLDGLTMAFTGEGWMNNEGLPTENLTCMSRMDYKNRMYYHRLVQSSKGKGFITFKNNHIN